MDEFVIARSVGVVAFDETMRRSNSVLSSVKKDWIASSLPILEDEDWQLLAMTNMPPIRISLPLTDLLQRGVFPRTAVSAP